MRLLVVDDDKDIRHVLSSVVQVFGYDADTAGDGYEAIKRLQGNQYDVVITDAQMPIVNGVELCRYLKFKFPWVHIVGMSGDLSSLKDLKKAGADFCIPKPFAMDKLEEAIHSRSRSPREPIQLQMTAEKGGNALEP